MSNSDIEMLGQKSGALDPRSPNFERDLRDYELTLLKIIHGPEAGKAIFDRVMEKGGAGNSGLPQSPAPQGVDQDVWDAMTPEDRALWAN